MNDLVCVAADKQIKATIEELLRRPRSLGIGPIQAELLLHPEHDPGCYVRPAEILRGYRQVAAHALIILDHDWDGVPTTSGADLEALIEEKLEREGMADWAVPVVIDPELEAWVFSASPHVPDVLGWKGAWSAFRQELEDQNLWTAEEVKPADPRAALEHVLRETGKSRSASLFRKLANRVNTAACQDRAFLRLKELLQGWFPPVSSTGGGEPQRPALGRTNTVETRPGTDGN